MAKQSGVGSALWFGAYDLSGDIGAVNTISTSRGVFDTTAIDKAAQERILGRRDGSLSFTAFWNHAAGALQPRPQPAAADGRAGHRRHRAVAGRRQSCRLAHRQADGLCAVLRQPTARSPRPSRHRPTATRWSGASSSPSGKQTFASGDINGDSIDGGGATAFGMAAYLHVFSLTSGDPVITITDSANDSDFATLGPTAIVFEPTAAGVERQQIGLDRGGAPVRPRRGQRDVHGPRVRPLHRAVHRSPQPNQSARHQAGQAEGALPWQR